MDLLLTEPTYRHYPFGNRRLATWGKRIPSEGSAAESWEVSARPEQPTALEGPAPDLAVLWEEARTDMGGAFRPVRFPWLLKYLDMSGPLPIHNHPDDDYARRTFHGHDGKAEAWVVLEASPGAAVLYGFEGSMAVAAEALRDGSFRTRMRRLPVKAGDVVSIPPGVPHATDGTMVVVEIQQNSDLSFFAERSLGLLSEEENLHHFLACLGNADPGAGGVVASLGPLEAGEGPSISLPLSFCEAAVLRLTGNAWELPRECLMLATVIRGAAKAVSGERVFELPLGQSMVIPASAPPVILSGPAAMLVFAPPAADGAGAFADRMR